MLFKENLPLQIIIAFLKADKNQNLESNNRIEYKDDNGVVYAIGNAHYLLGQLLRQYSLDWDHYLISKEAQELWDSLTDDNFGDYWYRYSVTITKPQPKGRKLTIYKGNRKSGEEIEIVEGRKFTFNDLFHDEHIVTINDIEDELISLKDDEITEENVINILNKIYICRMTKEEDRRLYPKRHRSTNYKEVLNGPYKNCEIFLTGKHLHG